MSNALKEALEQRTGMTYVAWENYSVFYLDFPSEEKAEAFGQIYDELLMPDTGEIFAIFRAAIALKTYGRKIEVEAMHQLDAWTGYRWWFEWHWDNAHEAKDLYDRISWLLER